MAPRSLKVNDRRRLAARERQVVLVALREDHRSEPARQSDLAAAAGAAAPAPAAPPSRRRISTLTGIGKLWNLNTEWKGNDDGR